MGSLRGAIKERGSMITKDMLDNFRRSISVGETLKIENPFTANIVREDPEVLRVMSKEKYFCRITNGAYEFCITWAELLRKMMGMDTEEQT